MPGGAGPGDVPALSRCAVRARTAARRPCAVPRRSSSRGTPRPASSCPGRPRQRGPGPPAHRRAPASSRACGGGLRRALVRAGVVRRGMPGKPPASSSPIVPAEAPLLKPRRPPPPTPPTPPPCSPAEPTIAWSAWARPRNGWLGGPGACIPRAAARGRPLPARTRKGSRWRCAASLAGPAGQAHEPRCQHSSWGAGHAPGGAGG